MSLLRINLNNYKLYGWIISSYTQAANTKDQLGNIIPLMYIKIMIHDKNKRKTQVIGKKLS